MKVHQFPTEEEPLLDLKRMSIELVRVILTEYKTGRYAGGKAKDELEVAAAAARIFARTFPEMMKEPEVIVVGENAE